MMNVFTQILRALPLLVLGLALGGCDSVDPTEPLGSADPVTGLEAARVGPAMASASFKGGIPFGVFHLPMGMYGEPFTSSLVNTSSSTSSLIPYLEAARKTGVRVVVSFVGSAAKYKNKSGAFDLAMWKKRVDAYRNVDFSTYVTDGTIIGHYILDEPHDAANWAGKTVPQATVDEMARYSKSIWPSMPTIIRGWPAYLKGYQYRYLDAAWAQYSDRFGSVSQFLSENVRDSKASGLALVVGLNQLAGGSKKGLTGFISGKYAMTADELGSWGKALINEPYACAFLSWAYDSKYLSRPDIKQTNGELAQAARSRSSKSCRGINGQTPVVEPPAPPVVEPPAPPVVVPPAPVEEQPVVTDSVTSVPADSEPSAPPAPPTPPALPTPPAPTPPAPTPPAAGGTGIELKVTGWSEKGSQYMQLTWSGAKGSSVDVYRDGKAKKNTENDRRYVNALARKTAATYAYKVCEKNTSVCSPTVRVSVK